MEEINNLLKKQIMELLSFIQPINEGDALEYKLHNEEKNHLLTNVATHVGDEIYKLKKAKKDTVNNKFKVEYSGNKNSIIDGLNHEVAHYILLQEKAGLRYLVSVDLFREIFTPIN